MKQENIKCPKCGIEAVIVKNGPHLQAKCSYHGHIKFICQPWQDFVMPIGKYAGKTLQEILKVDKKNLLWGGGTLRGSIAKQMQKALDSTHDLESIQSIIPRAFNEIIDKVQS
jgi:hypothetical protein